MVILLIFLLITIKIFHSIFKKQITGQTGNGGTKDVEIIVPLKYLSNSWRTSEMPLINCKVSLRLTCSRKGILAAGTAQMKYQNLE